MRGDLVWTVRYQKKCKCSRNRLVRKTLMLIMLSSVICRSLGDSSSQSEFLGDVFRILVGFSVRVDDLCGSEWRVDWERSHRRRLLRRHLWYPDIPIQYFRKQVLVRDTH